MTIPRGIHNAGVTPLSGIPTLSPAAFHDTVRSGIAAGATVSAFFAVPTEGSHCLYAVLAWKSKGTLTVVSTTATDRFSSLTLECPQVHLFEREIHEQTGLIPEGHPWLKPVRFPPTRPGAPPAPVAGEFEAFRVEGEEIHEVAVGPVHAGIIEPGHFRFQCHGEIVHHLEIMLGYQHRGVERALRESPVQRRWHLIETLAGDTTIGHATAYCQLLEAAGHCHVPPRAQVIRGIALELERIANHIGDLGALSGDVGFLPTASFCGRIRGDVLNLTALLCGNRFGRGLVRPGGVAYDISDAAADALQTRLKQVERDAESAVNLLWGTSSVMARFEGVGTVDRATAERIGLVGVAARASGVERDVRSDLPFGIYRMAQLPVVTWTTGDVFGRAFVRWMEIRRSIAFIQETVSELPKGLIQSECDPPAVDSMAVSLTEGWRGEICHVALFDHNANLAHYKVVDPSFHNWFGLALALRGQQISDFPLCNKSFNLSYCGYDL